MTLDQLNGETRLSNTTASNYDELVFAKKLHGACVSRGALDSDCTWHSLHVHTFEAMTAMCHGLTAAVCVVRLEAVRPLVQIYDGQK